MNAKTQRPRRTVARRILRGTANILFPVTESGWVIRALRHMLRSHRQRLRDALPEKHGEKPQVQLTWADAVAASGCSVALLARRFGRLRRRWCSIFWCLVTLATLLCGTGLHAAPLPPITLLRSMLTLFCLLACAGYCATRALSATYRLWQLRERRVSEAEKGTFRDFLDACRGWRATLWQSLTTGVVGRH